MKTNYITRSAASDLPDAFFVCVAFCKFMEASASKNSGTMK